MSTIAMPRGFIPDHIQVRPDPTQKLADTDLMAAWNAWVDRRRRYVELLDLGDDARISAADKLAGAAGEYFEEFSATTNRGIAVKLRYLLPYLIGPEEADEDVRIGAPITDRLLADTSSYAGTQLYRVIAALDQIALGGASPPLVERDDRDAVNKARSSVDIDFLLGFHEANWKTQGEVGDAVDQYGKMYQRLAAQRGDGALAGDKVKVALADLKANGCDPDTYDLLQSALQDLAEDLPAPNPQPLDADLAAAGRLWLTALRDMSDPAYAGPDAVDRLFDAEAQIDVLPAMTVEGIAVKLRRLSRENGQSSLDDDKAIATGEVPTGPMAADPIWQLLKDVERMTGLPERKPTPTGTAS